MKNISELKENVNEIEIFEMPEMKIIGKEIRCGGFIGNIVGELWDMCLEDGSIEILKAMPRIIPNALLGWSGNYTHEDKTYSYIVGVFVPLDTEVPKGFTFRILPPTLVGKGLFGGGYSFIGELKKQGYVTNYELRGWNVDLFFKDDPKTEKVTWTNLSPIRTITKTDFKEEITKNDINNANKNISKLTDVRIVYLPPAAVASVHFYCDEPERHANEVLDKFVRESNLSSLKPDLRHYGFNHPDPSPNTPKGMPDHGYEMWVTIPEDMTLPEPITKKFFPGGLYAAHMIKMGNFHEWQWLIDEVINSNDYEPNWGNPECMSGLLEEHLNYINHVNLHNSEPTDMQLDLLMPIRPKHKG